MRQGITPRLWLGRPIRPGRTPEMTPRMAAGGLVDLKLGHYTKDGIEVVDGEG